MSGAGKKALEMIKQKVLDVAPKDGQGINWDGLAKLLVSETAKKEFNNLRRAFEDVNSQLEAKFSMEPEPIDWDYYKKGLPHHLVDMYKKEYEKIEIPKYVDKITPEYKPKFDALLEEIKEAQQKCMEEHERLEAKVADMEDLRAKIPTMTVHEYFERYPDVKKKIDDEIRNDIYD